MASGVAFGENMEEGGTERGVRYLREETNCAVSSIKTASRKKEKTHSDLGVSASVSFLQSSG